MTDSTPDLFGAPTTAIAKPKEAGKYAYPAMPGTGPEGRRCRDCAHCVRIQLSRAYHKCLRNRGRWAHSSTTEINTRSPACRLFESEAGPAGGAATPPQGPTTTKQGDQR